MQRTAFITGGTGSVGQALVRAFSSSGYQVAFQFFSNQKRAQELTEETGATAIQMDFRKRASFSLPSTDILINNAAVNITRLRAAEVTLDDWDTNLSINLTWPFILARAALLHMVAQHWGRIVNISSIFGLRGCEGNLPYNVSKHGMSALTKTIAKEYGQFGIATNEICPGPIDSELLDRIAAYHAETESISREAYLQDLRQEIPTGRLASPGDVAQAALFLASDHAGYINGISLPVDGGLIA